MLAASNYETELFEREQVASHLVDDMTEAVVCVRPHRSQQPPATNSFRHVWHAVVQPCQYVFALLVVRGDGVRGPGARSVSTLADLWREQIQSRVSMLRQVECFTATNPARSTAVVKSKRAASRPAQQHTHTHDIPDKILHVLLVLHALDDRFKLVVSGQVTLGSRFELPFRF